MSLFDKLTIAVPALASARAADHQPAAAADGALFGGRFLPRHQLVGATGGCAQGVRRPHLRGGPRRSGHAPAPEIRAPLARKYQKEISDHFYFRNVSNNAGIFDYIVRHRAEQECKEAFLAYYFLLTAAEPPDQEALDEQI